MNPWNKIGPEEEWTYAENWSDALEGGTLVSSEWSSDIALEIVDEGQTGAEAWCKVRVKPGAAVLGEAYRLTNKITSGDAKGVRSRWLKVENL